jgi:formate dehydrogenase subunit gamma
MSPASTTYITRFTFQQRVEHFVTMIIFTVLCLTGLSEKFYTAGWAKAVVELLGGIDSNRLIHRVCGFVMAISTVVHFANASLTMLSRKVGFTMVPDKKDFEDAILQLRYYLGLTEAHPHYDRYDYKQKFEYWGLVFGNIIMVVTGLILIFPVQFAFIAAGQIIPAAKVAHSNEGLMAFLVITIWHIFNAHLNPDVFPFDASMFTGKISRERMLHEHPVELARMEGRAFDPGADHAPAHRTGPEHG